MKTRIALLSDVHGNLTALKAVIADLSEQAIDDCWFLGDLVMPGPATNEVFELLESINTSVYIRGNWDDCFLDVQQKKVGTHFGDPSDVYIGLLGQYVAEHLRIDYQNKLKSLPIHTVKQVNGLSINLSHNLNTLNSGPALLADAATSHFDELFAEHPTDIAIYGHVHHQMLRYSSKDQMVINPGSVGQPFFKHGRLNNDRRAQYAILEIDDTGLAEVNFRKVAYDLTQELKLAKESALPYLNLYQEILFDGVAHTHDDELLDKINQQYGYVELLKQLTTQ